MKFIAASLEPGVMTLPLFTERCAAGFPSPAADYTEAELDLNEYCIRHRASTWQLDDRYWPEFRRPDGRRQGRDAGTR